MQREDPKALEARLRARDQDQVSIGRRGFTAPNPYLARAPVPEFDLSGMMLQDEQPNPQQVVQGQGQQGQGQGQQGQQQPGGGLPQDGLQAPPLDGGEEMFAALGAALDEIEAEERQGKKEYMAPTKDVVEAVPGYEARYKSFTRSFIGATDPLLANRPKAVVRPGQLVTTVDRGLEELLTISLARARHAHEQRRAVDVRTYRRSA